MVSSRTSFQSISDSKVYALIPHRAASGRKFSDDFA